MIPPPFLMRHMIVQVYEPSPKNITSTSIRCHLLKKDRSIIFVFLRRTFKKRSIKKLEIDFPSFTSHQKISLFLRILPDFLVLKVEEGWIHLRSVSQYFDRQYPL